MLVTMGMGFLPGPYIIDTANEWGIDPTLINK